VEPELSVVVPVYEAELYLAPCLESIARQTFDDLEVILVDDGSMDGSRDIARKFVERDRRFRLVCQENSGSGTARNTGVRHATGRYLTFSDCDDIVADDAYERLVGSLRETGSDIACGGVRRFNHNESWPSVLHLGIFDTPYPSTHITRWTALLRDRTVWNKVYRRSFWDKRDLAFPEHPFEDGCITVAAHVLADSVDLVAGPVYFWRQRDDGPLSTTQRLFDPPLLEGRMRQVATISDFLAQHSMCLKSAYDVLALEHDVLILLMALPHIEPPLRDRILRFAAEICRDVDRASLEELQPRDRECYRLLELGDTHQLCRHLLDRSPGDFL
jgi:CDP-glycerol glycerophosphotransferase